MKRRNHGFHRDLRLAAFVAPRGVVGPRRLRSLRALHGMQGRRRPSDVELAKAGAIPMRVHRPPPGIPPPYPALLWIHGGGYVMGHARQDDQWCREVAAVTGAVVAAVDYRLAPEHPFPAGLHDCYDALIWLSEREDIDRDRIAVGGASAGGGLAAAVALLARERRQVALVFQLLVYPMLDDRTPTGAVPNRELLRLWDEASNSFGWGCYVGSSGGGADVTAMAAPSRASDLSCLPAAWIGVGSLDLFRDEDVVYATRLRDAGVPCALEVVEGAFHGFDVVRPRAPVSRRFREAQLRALADALEPFRHDQSPQ